MRIEDLGSGAQYRVDMVIFSGIRNDRGRVRAFLGVVAYFVHHGMGNEDRLAARHSG